MASVTAVCISERKGTQKHEVPEIQLKIDHGIVGDAHAGNWHQVAESEGMVCGRTMRVLLEDVICSSQTVHSVALSKRESQPAATSYTDIQ